MHDPPPMSVLECATDLLDEIQEHPARERTVRRQPLRGGPAAQQPHDEERGPRFTPEVVDRHDVGMLQARHEPGLVLEAPDEVGIVGELRADDLHGHLALDPRLHGSVHHGERPRTDPLTELVAVQGAGRPGERDIAAGDA